MINKNFKRLFFNTHVALKNTAIWYSYEIPYIVNSEDLFLVI